MGGNRPHPVLHMSCTATTTTATTAAYSAQKHVDASTILKGAFEADPVVRYFWPDDTEYEKMMGTYFSRVLWVLSTSYEMTDVVTDNEGHVTACATWEPAHKSVMCLVRFLYVLLWCAMVMGVGRTWDSVKMMMMLEKKQKHHAPTALHLAVIGTGVAFQGKGMGSRCIQVGLDRADKQGLPCYLESSNPKNIPFYEKMGFRTVETLNIADGKGPLMTLMLREARKDK